MRDRARTFLRAISWIVPARRRREFLDEWQAELDADAGSASPRHRARRASGALRDAMSLRREDWNGAGLWQDLRYAVRIAGRRPQFTALVTATLTVGIGGTTAVFGILNAVLFRPLPYADPDRLLVVWEHDRQTPDARLLVSPATFADLNNEGRAFASLIAYFAGTANMTMGAAVERVTIGSVTAGFHDTLGVPPLIGRGFQPADGDGDVVLLSHAAWQSRFGGDPGIVGRQVVLNETPYRVAGVMPRGFFLFDRDVDFWRPHVISARAARIRDIGLFSVVGRLRDGVDLGLARDEMARLAARADPSVATGGAQRGLTLVTMREQVVGTLRRPLYVLWAAVTAVLLVGCANVANLLLASGAGRRRELGVRTALGASRGRLVRQLLIEGLFYSTLGGAGGLLLAWSSAGLLSRLVSGIRPEITDVHPDWRVFACGAALSIITGLVFAALPALLSTRVEPGREAGAGGRTVTTRAARRLGRTLAISDVALAVLVVCGASLALRSFWQAQSVDIGIPVEEVLTGDVTLPVSRYFGVTPVVDFHEAVQQRLLAAPGVRAVGATNALPLSGAGTTDTMTIDGNAAPASDLPPVGVRFTTPGYFAAIGIGLIEGRVYAADDRSGTELVAVVNETLAKQLLAGRGAIGARLRFGRRPAWHTVIGVVSDVHHNGPERPVVPEAYVPMAQGATSMSASVVVRVAGRPETFATALRDAVRSIDPQLAVASIRPMDDLLDAAASGRRASTLLLAALGALTLALAVVGIYGIVSHGVTERMPEFGLRLALGASRGELLRLVLRDGARIAFAGLVPGIATAVAGGLLARSLLFGIPAADPIGLAGAAGVVLAFTIAASYLPARRAARLDPIATLRQ